MSARARRSARPISRVLVLASVQISSGALGDGKIELRSDAANPPTTVRGTHRVGTAATVNGGQIACLVKAGHYYVLQDVTAGGTPSYAVIGDIQEIVL